MVFSPRKNPSLCHPNTREREAPTTATSTATATATAVATATAMSVEEKVEEGGESKKEQGEGGAEGAIPAPTKIDKAREQKTGREMGNFFLPTLVFPYFLFFLSVCLSLSVRSPQVGALRLRHEAVLPGPEDDQSGQRQDQAAGGGHSAAGRGEREREKKNYILTDDVLLLPLSP